MSAVLFALALFGCSDDATACRRLDMPVHTYATRAECTAQMDEALDSEAAMRADAPTVYAQCLSSRQLAAFSKGTVDLNRINDMRLASAAN